MFSPSAASPDDEPCFRASAPLLCALLERLHLKALLNMTWVGSYGKVRNAKKAFPEYVS